MGRLWDVETGKVLKRTAGVCGTALTSFRKEPNMTTWLTRCFAGLLLVLPFVPAVADDPDDKEIARLVKQLGSSDFRMRDAATKRLKELGEPAVDAVIRAMMTKDVEARRRAEQIVAVIEDRLYGPELWRLARDTKRASQQLGLALRELLQDRQAPG